MANKNNDIVIVSAARTPFGKYMGSLHDISYSELGTIPIREALKRANIHSNIVGEVFWGVGGTSAIDYRFSSIAARQTLIKAGLPDETPSVSLDMAGLSGMHAIKLAAMSIKLGEIDCAVAGGATSYERKPLEVGKRKETFMIYWGRDFGSMALDCDNVAIEHGVERSEQDEWALRSHINYSKAWNAGKFKEEILPLSITQEKGKSMVLDIDEQYHSNITMDELANLPTINGTNTITIANSTGLNDGASAILLMTRGKAIENGLEPLAIVISNISTAINASRMPEAPGYAIQMVCKKAGLTLDDIDIIEINEDFACVPLVSLRIAAGDDKKKLRELKDKTNVNGSAIAIGNPSTATGARIIMGLIYELRRRGGGYALGAIGGNLAQAGACVIKVD